MASQKLLHIPVVVALLLACSAILAGAQTRIISSKVIPPPPSPKVIPPPPSPKVILPPSPPKNWNPWQGEVIPPEPSKGYYRYLKGCADILTDACGREVFDYTFLRINELSPGCCVNLVKMGELCNKAMSSTLSRIERYKKWQGHIYQRSLEAYHNCNGTEASAPN